MSQSSQNMILGKRYKMEDKKSKNITKTNESLVKSSRSSKQNSKNIANYTVVQEAKRVRKVEALLDQVDQLVTLWFKSLRARNQEVSKAMLCSQAMKFARTLNVGEFEADAAWLNRWKKGERIKLSEVPIKQYLDTEWKTGDEAGLKLNFEEDLETETEEHFEDSDNLEADLNVESEENMEQDFQTNTEVFGANLKEDLNEQLDCKKEMEESDFVPNFAVVASDIPSNDYLDASVGYIGLCETESVDVIKNVTEELDETPADFEYIIFDDVTNTSVPSHSEAFKAFKTLQNYLAVNNSSMNIDDIEMELLSISQKAMEQRKCQDI